MKNIFIIHGAYGHPQENWFPWLKGELEKLNHKVFVPKFPTPKKQSLANWMKIFEKHKKNINDNTIFVGHSLGCGFILNILEQIENKIQSVFLIAGWTGLLNDPLDKINKTFIGREFNWEKISGGCKKFYVFNSDNDPYISLDKGQTLAKNLGTELIIVKNAGHFNEKAGYTTFELLLEKIKKEL